MRKNKTLWPFALAGALAVSNLGALAMPITALAADSVTITLTYEDGAIGAKDGSGKQVAGVYLNDGTDVNSKYVAGTKPEAVTKTVPGTSVTDGNALKGKYANASSGWSLDGYDFNGWSETIGTVGGDRYDFKEAYSLTASKTVYPAWDAKSNSITYTVDSSKASGSGTGTAKTTFKSGETIVAPTLEELDRTILAGQEFTGWKVGTFKDDPTTSATETTGYFVAPGATTVKMAGDVTLTAQFEEMNVLTLDANGSSASIDVSALENHKDTTSLYADKNGKVKLPTKAYAIWSGYTLKGWSTIEKPTKPSNIVAPGTEVTISEDTTYYAQWEKNDYTLTLELDATSGGTLTANSNDFRLVPPSSSGTVYTVDGVSLGDTIDLSEVTAALSGKSLVGWVVDTKKTTPDYTGNITLDESIFTKTESGSAVTYSLKLTALYEAGYTVTYLDATDGTGSPITGTGYATNNVFTKTKGVTVLDYPANRIHADIGNDEFVGWTVKKPSGDFDVKQVDADALAIINGDSAATGIFVEVGNTIKIGSAPFNSNVVLVPVILSQETISFTTDSYDSGKMDAVKLFYGDEITLPKNTFKKNGSAFQGWKITDASPEAKYDGKPVAQNDVIPDGAKLTEVKSTLSLEVEWGAPQTFKVTFIANGGSGTMKAQEITEQAGDKLAKCGFTAPADKKFGGWAVEASGAAVYDDEASTEEFTEDTILYATWVDDGSKEATKEEAIKEAEAAADAALANPTDETIKKANDAVAAAKSKDATDAELKVATDKIAQAVEAKKKADEAAKKSDGSSKDTPAPVGNELKNDKGEGTGYVVTNADKAAPEVEFKGTDADRSSDKVTIPAEVKDQSGNVYKVTSIADSALENAKGKELVIGKNIKKIGKKALKGAKFKKITIKTNKKGQLKIGKGAFKVKNKKCVIKIKGAKDKYKKKLIKKIKKQATKGVTVK